MVFFQFNLFLQPNLETQNWNKLLRRISLLLTIGIKHRNMLSFPFIQRGEVIGCLMSHIWYNIIGYVNLYHICFRFIDPHYFESMFGSNNVVVYVFGATEDTDYDSSIGNQCLKIIIRFPPESGYWNYDNGIWNFYATISYKSLMLPLWFTTDFFQF